MSDALDRINRQIMWDRLQAVVEEQGQTLTRAAFSPIVRECGDISAGIFDLDGLMIAQAVTGTPGHINTMAASVGHFIKHFRPQTMRPGDIYMTNDPWMGSGHLNDFVLVRPCFLDDRLIGYNSCTSHLIDLGGRGTGPEGRDVHEEGLYIPMVKLVDQGAINETLMDIVRANSRMPVQNEGDVYALIACAEVGEERLIAMMREFAIDGLDDLGRHILKTSEDATRRRIAELPDGVWDHELRLDGYDFEIALKARLAIEGDTLTVDFTGTSPASRFGINVPITYAQAYTVFGLKCIIAPDIPNNAGALAPFIVTAPEGSILNPLKPAPVSQRHVIGQLLPDTVFGCLDQAMPGRVPAEGTGCLWSMVMRSTIGSQADGNAPAFMIEPVHNGGTGGRPSSDGLSATAYPSGVMGSQVELTESTCPLIIRRRELRPDSAGDGAYRGGFGQILEIEHSAGAPFMLGSAVERVTYPPRGRHGGHDGAAGELWLASGAALPAKGEKEIPAGDRLIIKTPGGGGYGDPARRDAALRDADRRDGLVTAKQN